MASPRRCSECSRALTGNRKQRTCSDTCRTNRSRRLRREERETRAASVLPPEQQEIRQITHGDRDDEIHRVVQEELRPVVRESITEDTLRAIQSLIALTPEVVEAIADDLRDDDKVIRQRAYSLIAKYTIGHPAIVRPPEEDTGKQLVVHFNVPRPEAVPQDAEQVIDAEQPAVELDDPDTRQCDNCGEDKPLIEFVASSSRCVACFEEQQTRAQELFG